MLATKRTSWEEYVKAKVKEHGKITGVVLEAYRELIIADGLVEIMKLTAEWETYVQRRKDAEQRFREIYPSLGRRIGLVNNYSTRLYWAWHAQLKLATPRHPPKEGDLGPNVEGYDPLADIETERRPSTGWRPK